MSIWLYLVAFPATFFVAVQIVRSWQAGVAFGHKGGFSRDVDPLGFWVLFSLHALAAICMVLFLIDRSVDLFLS